MITQPVRFSPDVPPEPVLPTARTPGPRSSQARATIILPGHRKCMPRKSPQTPKFPGPAQARIGRCPMSHGQNVPIFRAVRHLSLTCSTSGVLRQFLTLSSCQDSRARGRHGRRGGERGLFEGAVAAVAERKSQKRETVFEFRDHQPPSDRWPAIHHTLADCAAT